MKIGTDGVLLGAIAANIQSQKVLDIGTGCGLIGLMVAQKQNAIIDCVEIDNRAYSDAKENIENSPWSNKFRLFKTSFQEFAKLTKKKYDLIVCNPPFFHNSLKPYSNQRNTARHSDSLSFCDLITGVCKIISSDGKFLLIFPSEQQNDVSNILINNGLFVNEKWNIRPNPDKEVHRIIICGSKVKTDSFIINEIAIENGLRHQYSDEYKNLTCDYCI
ncbi:MAG: methyltransferase [Bacteroidetes bacterium]|nr:methyltransferase [Bacteroidota bacterium]